MSEQLVVEEIRKRLLALNEQHQRWLHALERPGFEEAFSSQMQEINQLLPGLEVKFSWQTGIRGFVLAPVLPNPDKPRKKKKEVSA